MRTSFIDKSEFEVELDNLVRRAINSDVDPNGSVSVCQSSAQALNYEVLITEFVSATDPR